MSLLEKNEKDIDGISISTTYNEENIDKSILIRNTYANMRLAKCKKVINVFVLYNKNNEIVKLDLKILCSSDDLFNEVETMNLAESLRIKRGLKIESHKIGRNDLCPCGSGKKYKKCCLLK